MSETPGSALPLQNEGCANYKKRTDKRMTLGDAVAAFVHDGGSIVFSGMGGAQCVAHAYEIIRQMKKDMTLIGDSPCDAGDMLMGAGVLKRAELAWCGYAVAGLGPNYRRITEKNIPHDMELVDYSNYTIGLRLMAGAMGLPFLPTRSLLGSDLMTYNADIKQMIDPYSGEAVALVPAVHPDTALIHCSRADKHGNAQIFGFTANAENTARAAKHCIITCEELVDTDVIRRHPHATVIPGFAVDAVVHLPFACHPWNFPYEYAYDIPFHGEQTRAFKTREGFLAWLDTWCFGIKDHDAYLDKVGRERLRKLAEIEQRFCPKHW